MKAHAPKVPKAPAHDSKRLLPLFFAMGRLLKHEMAKDGKGVPSFLHLETLRFIEEAKRPTMSEIAEYLRVTAPTATTLVNSFVQEGVLTRVEDTTDRRRVRMMLSPAGRALLHTSQKARERAFARVVGSLSVSDQKEMERLLSLITTNHSA